GNQGCLALRQDENTCYQAQPCSDGGEKPEEHHRLMERVLIGVWTCELWLAVRIRPEHVVINEQIVIAEGLGGLSVILDSLDIVPEFCLGKHHTVLHDRQSLQEETFGFQRVCFDARAQGC